MQDDKQKPNDRARCDRCRCRRTGSEQQNRTDEDEESRCDCCQEPTAVRVIREEIR